MSEHFEESVRQGSAVWAWVAVVVVAGGMIAGVVALTRSVSRPPAGRVVTPAPRPSGRTLFTKTNAPPPPKQEQGATPYEHSADQGNV